MGFRDSACLNRKDALDVSFSFLHDGDMDTPSEEQQRLVALGKLVIDRRVRLKMKKAVDLAAAMEVSPRLVGDIENGRRRVSDATYAALDEALEWKAGSASTFLDLGQEPDFAPVSTERVVRPGGALSPRVAEEAFNAWAELYVQLLPAEFRYAATRGLDLAAAQEELREILNMAQQGKEGRPWTPPWSWRGEGEPWLDNWWRTPEGRDHRRVRGVPDAREVSAPDETVAPAAEHGDVEEPGEGSI